MYPLRQVADVLQRLAPLELAEEWDNVGLLLGSWGHPVRRVMTCLTLTAPVAQEAVEHHVQLVVTHHPIPFRPLKRITDETPTGEVLWQLAQAGICVYSAHTAFDSAADGINQALAAGVGLEEIEPLVLPSEPQVGSPPAGTGRRGRLVPAIPLRELVERVKGFLAVERLQVVGPLDRRVQQVAVVCGSGGALLPQAIQAGCEVFLTGEMRFHDCLEAQARGVALVLPGHYATERFALEQLARQLAQALPELEVWPSRQERDPLQWV